MQQDISKKGSFFAGLGQSNDFDMSSIPTWQENGTSAKFSNKDSCWQCFKLYKLDVNTSKYKDGERGFCSGECHAKYHKLNSKGCDFHNCGKVFLKELGIRSNGKWYCSAIHAMTDPETKKVNDKLAEPLPKAPVEE